MSGFYPEPDSTNVPVDTNISVTISRPAQIVEVSLNPEVEVANVTMEMVGVASGKYTFNLAKPLQPETAYTAKLTFGQEEFPGYEPTRAVSWSFTTAPAPVTD